MSRMLWRTGCFALFILFSGCTTHSSKSLLKQILTDRKKWIETPGKRIVMYRHKNPDYPVPAPASLSRLDSAAMNALEFTGELNYSRPIRIIVTPDMAGIKDLTGKTTNGIAFPKENLIVEMDGVTGACHEILHLIGTNSWGKPKAWISEGMAVYCDDNWWGYDLHALARYLQLNRKLTPLKALIRDKGFHSIDPRYSYPQAGSMVRFIDQQYGRQKLIKLWQTNDFSASLGKTAEEIEIAWLNVIEDTSAEGIRYPE